MSKRRKKALLTWTRQSSAGSELMFSIRKMGVIFRVTEKDGSRDFDLYGALAHAVEISNRYDATGSYKSEYTEADYDEVAQGDADATNYVKMPLSLSYIFVLDRYATPSYRALRPYVMDAIKMRAMTRSTDDTIRFRRMNEK